MSGSNHIWPFAVCNVLKLMGERMDEDAIGPKILWKIGEGLGFFGTPAHCSNERFSFLLAEGNCLQWRNHRQGKPLFVITQSPFSLVQQPSTSSMGCASFATCVSYQYIILFIFVSLTLCFRHHLLLLQKSDSKSAQDTLVKTTCRSW